MQSRSINGCRFRYVLQCAGLSHRSNAVGGELVRYCRHYGVWSDKTRRRSKYHYQPSALPYLVQVAVAVAAGSRYTPCRLKISLHDPRKRVIHSLRPTQPPSSAGWEMSTGQGEVAVLSGWEGIRRSGDTLATVRRRYGVWVRTQWSQKVR